MIDYILCLLLIFTTGILVGIMGTKQSFRRTINKKMQTETAFQTYDFRGSSINVVPVELEKFRLLVQRRNFCNANHPTIQGTDWKETLI